MTQLVPHDIAAEEAVVAACLLDDDAVLRVVGEGLQPADFHDEFMGKAYRCCIALVERGEPVTVPTLAHEMARLGALDQMGGEPALVSMVGRHFTAIGVEAHARIVIRDAQYRRLITAAGQIARLAHEGGPDAAAVMDEAQSLLRSVDVSLNGDVLPVGHYIENELPEDDRRLHTAGYAALDRMIRGVAEGELLCIGARTDHGKTGLSSGMAYRQALAGVPVAYVPVEGSVGNIMHRCAATSAGVSLGYAAQVGWRDGEERAYWRHYNDLHDLPLYFPDQRRIPRTIPAIASWITRAVRQYGVRVAYIDHLDAIVLERDRGQALSSAYAEALKRLQELAGRESVAIVFASQVSREGTRSGDVAPPMSFMRESGAKEEASQTVLMIGLQEDAHRTLFPEKGQWMHVHVAKLKDYAGNRKVGAEGAPDAPVLYLDERSGAVRELGERLMRAEKAGAL